LDFVHPVRLSGCYPGKIDNTWEYSNGQFENASPQEKRSLLFLCGVVYNNLMNAKKIIQELNFVAQCKKYHLPLWQCPQFLFLIMGVFISSSSIITYAIGTHYIDDPTIIAFIVLLLAMVLFIIAFLVVQSFEKLAEANRMKTEFIGIVSHQLRSPLSNLNWAIEFLMSGSPGRITEQQVEYFKILKENSSRMQELVSDLLTVSRIQSATLPINQKQFSLIDLTKKTLKQFEPFARASNVELGLERQSDSGLIMADPDQIKQVISNLIDNAIRYIKGKGKVTIKIEHKGRHIYFEIKDTGVGISKQDQKYIFQKFFRAQGVLKHQTQGSGLGLFIAKSIIKRSGGKIGFKSQEGEGSTFYFTLPI